MEAAVVNNSTDPQAPERNQRQRESALSDSTEKVSRTIRAAHTATTVRVYQAYGDAIADAALEGQPFRLPLERGLWSASRMTWIKPSKVWMAYRCGWTILKDGAQARVLALDLDRTKFEELLAQGVLSRAGSSTKGSGKKCRNNAVVVQWDPERRIVASENGRQAYTEAIPRTRSIQIGLRPPANDMLLDPEFVVRITDVTRDFREAARALQSGRDVADAAALLWPDGLAETVLRVPNRIELSLEMTSLNTAGTGSAQGADAVVVLGCAANPPHQGHFHCLEAAKSKAEQLGYNVLWTTIAAAPSGYVHNKMKRASAASAGSMNDAPRKSMVLSDKIRMSVLQSMASWAMARDPSLMFLMPQQTYGSALECGRSLRPSPDVKVIVVVGGDRFKWTKRCHPDLITFGCARDEAQFTKLGKELEEGVQKGLVNDPEKWVLTSSVGPNTSSTLVRGILANSEWSETEKRERLRKEGYPIHAANTLINIDSSAD